MPYGRSHLGPGLGREEIRTREVLFKEQPEREEEWCEDDGGRFHQHAEHHRQYVEMEASPVWQEQIQEESADDPQSREQVRAGRNVVNGLCISGVDAEQDRSIEGHITVPPVDHSQ